MDEKGFHIGHLQKTRRIFPKALMETQKLQALAKMELDIG
jgi:hypothetical protein